MYDCCYIIYVFQICMEMRFYKLKTSFHKLQTKMLILKLGQALFFRSWIHHYITIFHIPRMIGKSNNSQNKLSAVMTSLAKSRSVLGVCSWCRVSSACGVWNVTLISLSDRATSDPPSSDWEQLVISDINNSFITSDNFVFLLMVLGHSY